MVSFYRLFLLLLTFSMLVTNCGYDESVFENMVECRDRIMKPSKSLALKEIDHFILQEKEGSYLGRCRMICVDENSNLYYGCQSSNQIVVFNSEGKQLRRIGQFGKNPDQILKLKDFDVKNGKVYIFSSGTKQITVFDTLGNFISHFKLALKKTYPCGPALKVLNNNILLTETTRGLGTRKRFYYDTFLVSDYNMDGDILKRFGRFDKDVINKELFNASFTGFPQLHIDANNNIYLWNQYISQIHKFDNNYELVERYDVKSPRWVSSEIFKNSIPKHEWEVSFIRDIHLLESTNKMLIFHSNLNRKNGVRLRNPFANIKNYLDVYDLDNNNFYYDFDISILIGKNYPQYAYDSKDNIYIMTDNTTDNVTITKYKLLVN